MRLRPTLVTPFALCAIAVLAGCSSADSKDNSATTDDALTRVCGASPSGAVQGVDVSYYQGNFDWAGAHVAFGATRVSDGTGFIDPTFDENWAHMKAAGVLRSAYQFFEPGDSEVAQANLVIAKVGRLGAGDLPVMLDIEVTGGQSPGTIRARAQHWLDLVEAGTGKKPFVYSYGSFLETNLGSGFGAYPLWIAAYGGSCPSVPAGWSNWAIWQYSDGSGHLDHDVFNGSEAQLQEFAGGGGSSSGGGAGGASSVVETAFQANTGDLWTVGTAGNKNWSLGMRAATSPAIASLSSGGFQVAFQANTSDLWTVGSAGNKDWGLGMMAGTSPSITALDGGGFEVAFQANTGDLWTVGDAGNKNWSLGMAAGTSPSITAVSGGFEVAFQANTGSLWTVGNAGDRDWSLGMKTGTSPSITAVSGGFEVAFQANTSDLWTVGTAGNKDWALGMMTGTSPAIASVSGGFEVAFQANTSDLWTVGDAGAKDWALGMAAGTSPTIAALPGGGYRATFQANTSSLWSAGTDGVSNYELGLMAGSSPSGS